MILSTPILLYAAAKLTEFAFLAALALYARRRFNRKATS